MMRKTGQQEHEVADHIIYAARRQTGRIMVLSSLSSIPSPGDPAQDMVPSTFKLGLLYSLKPFWKHPFIDTPTVYVSSDSKSSQVAHGD